MTTSNIDLPYQSTEQLEYNTTKLESKLYLNAWTTQNIVYELITNYMLANDPAELGFTFNSRYKTNPNESGIYVDIAYNWDVARAGKRPAIFIQRDDVDIKGLTMGSSINQLNMINSEDERTVLNNMEVIVKCIASPVGFVEQLAEYVKQPLLYYQQEIQRDFNFRKFRLTKIGRPQIYVEAKDNFAIMLGITVVFDEGWVIKGDHIKLSTVGRVIFDNVLSRPLRLQ